MSFLKTYKYFCFILCGLLYCVWSFGLEWINLLGPAEIWLDNVIYYVCHSFEVRPEYTERHYRALELLAEEKGPKEWIEEIIYKNDPFELV